MRSTTSKRLKPPSDAEVAGWLERHREETVDAIAKTVPWSRDTVYRYMRAAHGNKLGYRHRALAGRWTASEVEVIRDRREAGDSLQKIANDYDVSRERIRQVLARDGYDKVRGPGKPSARWRHKPCIFCGQDYPKGTYQQHCREAKHPTKAIKPTEHLYDEQIVEMYTRGARIVDISIATNGQTFHSIYRILRRNGIEPTRGVGKYVRDDTWLRRRRDRELTRKMGGKVTTSAGWRAG